MYLKGDKIKNEIMLNFKAQNVNIYFSVQTHFTIPHYLPKIHCHPLSAI